STRPTRRPPASSTAWGSRCCSATAGTSCAPPSTACVRCRRRTRSSYKHATWSRPRPSALPPLHCGAPTRTRSRTRSTTSPRGSTPSTSTSTSTSSIRRWRTPMASRSRAISTAWTWLSAGSFNVGLSVLVDPLSVFMMLIVTGVGALIVGYSIGYMDGEDEERRYFAYMALFVFSMLLLVQGGNLLMLLIGWGLVGLSSYLLIGFWHERPSAIAAAKKAFVMNAIGDATMALALFLLIQRTG